MVTLGETAEEPHGWQVPVRCPGEEACLVLAPVSVTESQADHALSVGLLFHWTVGPPGRNWAVLPVRADCWSECCGHAENTMDVLAWETNGGDEK